MRKILLFLLVVSLIASPIVVIPVSAESDITFYVNHDFNSVAGGKQITVTNIAADPTTQKQYEVLGESYPWRTALYGSSGPTFAYDSDGDTITGTAQPYNNTTGFINGTGKNTNAAMTMELKNAQTGAIESTCGNDGNLSIDLRIKRTGANDHANIKFYDAANNVITTLYLPNGGTPSQAPRINATSLSNGTPTTTTIANAQTTNWWYYKVTLNFNNHTLQAYIGETLNTLMPFREDTTVYNFYNSAATNFYKVSFDNGDSAKGAFAFDDFRVYSISTVRCTTLPFTDANGKTVTSLYGQTVVNANVQVENRLSTPQHLIMATAAFQNEKMIGVKLTQPPKVGGILDPGEIVTLSTQMNLADYDGVDLIKTFVWDSMGTLKPLLATNGEIKYIEPDNYIFGVLQNTTAHLTQNYQAGMRMGILELQWSNFYSTEGVENTTYINSKKAELQALRNAGYQVMLGFGTQYAPSWIYNYPNSRFKNQYGDSYSGGNGETGVNVVFNDAMRQKQAAYIADVFSEFGTDFAMVRLGFMRYGEIGYPHPTYNGHTNSYWAYDDIAQGNAGGLPAGISPCTVKGWIPGQASTNHDSARIFANWYLGALKNYHDWQIDLVSSYYSGKMAMLYPSWGVRNNQLDGAINVDLNGTTSVEINGELQRGFDFKSMIQGIDNPNVVVYGTWIDSNPDWSDDDSANPQNPCPIHYLSDLAKNHPLKLHVMGENTGGGGITAMDLTFQRMEKYGLDGLMWAFESDLYDTTSPTLADYAARIGEYQDK